MESPPESRNKDCNPQNTVKLGKPAGSEYFILSEFPLDLSVSRRGRLKSPESEVYGLKDVFAKKGRDRRRKRAC